MNLYLKQQVWMKLEKFGYSTEEEDLEMIYPPKTNIDT